jgi:hypothetical protein
MSFKHKSKLSDYTTEELKRLENIRAIIDKYSDDLAEGRKATLHDLKQDDIAAFMHYNEILIKEYGLSPA